MTDANDEKKNKDQPSNESTNARTSVTVPAAVDRPAKRVTSPTENSQSERKVVVGDGGFPFDASHFVQIRHRDFHDHLDAAVKVFALLAAILGSVFAWRELAQADKLQKKRYAMEFVLQLGAGELSSTLDAASAPVTNIINKYSSLQGAEKSIDAELWRQEMSQVDERPFRRLVVFFENAHICGAEDVCDEEKIFEMLEEDAAYLMTSYAFLVCDERKIDSTYATRMQEIAGDKIDSNFCDLYE